MDIAQSKIDKDPYNHVKFSEYLDLPQWNNYFLRNFGFKLDFFSKIEEIQTVPTPESALNFNLPQNIEKICNEHDLTCVKKVK